MPGLTRLVRMLLTERLPITLVVVLAFAAIYLLLPRPRGNRPLWGALAGGAALLIGGGWLVRAGALTPESLLFYVFSAVAIIAGALLITQRNPARAALAFALVVLSTCGLFLLLAAPFLMAATTIVYAGAIVVTFLFVIMLAQQEGLSDADQRSREPLLSSVAGALLLGALLYALGIGYQDPHLQEQLSRVEHFLSEIKGLPHEDERPTEQATETARNLDKFLDGFVNGEKLDEKSGDQWKIPPAQVLGGQPLSDAIYVVRDQLPNLEPGRPIQEPIPWERVEIALLKVRRIGGEALNRRSMFEPREGTPLSPLSGPGSNEELRRDAQGRPELPAENTAYLGRSLFTDYLLTVELAGTLLLVATIGAIAIATRRGQGSGDRGQESEVRSQGPTLTPDP